VKATLPDRRLNAFRTDIADERLRGDVDAARYVKGWPAVVTSACVDVRSAPTPDAGIDTQFLLGDRVTVFDTTEGWAWVQGERDGYVGYAAEAELSGDPADPSTHCVTVPRTFVYPGPDLRLPPVRVLSMGSRLAVQSEEGVRGTHYAVLADGTAIVSRHLGGATAHASDYVAVAEQFINTPYLWGGATAFGLDCSGLVQLSMFMAGRRVQRDSDMQEATIGEKLQTDDAFSNLQRGDLVFWKGHVGIMTSSTDMLHANGATMTVALEPLKDAIDRIAPLYGLPTSVRRP
jgi:cell wall-associated NlpC family hydrolase